MQDSSIGNTHAQIVDLPNVRLFFAPVSNPQVEKEVLTMQLRDTAAPEGENDNETGSVSLQSVHDRTG